MPWRRSQSLSRCDEPRFGTLPLPLLAGPHRKHFGVVPVIAWEHQLGLFESGKDPHDLVDPTLAFCGLLLLGLRVFHIFEQFWFIRGKSCMAEELMRRPTAPKFDTLVVFVVEARDLPLSFQGSEPIVEITTDFNSQSFKIPLSRDTLSPTWTTTCKIFIASEEEEEFGNIVISMTEPSIKSTGVSRIPIKKYADGKPYSGWFRMVAQKSSTNIKRSSSRATSPVSTPFGEIHLKFQSLVPARDIESPKMENYKLGEIIGKGRYSDVYLATRDNQNYAVKVLDKTYLSIQELKLLRREVDIMKRLDHPNIVKLLDVVEEQRFLHLVLEYIDGGELLKVLSTRASFSEIHGAYIIKQILEGIAYCHSLGIAHRDLKPANIMLTGEEDIVKIVDFGFGNNLTGDGDKFSTICGTPDFMAPEVLDADAYGLECDVWSIGVITFILLCGTAPFRPPVTPSSDTRLNTNALVKNILECKYSFTEKHWESVSSDAKKFIGKILIRDPLKRYSANQALHDPWIKSSSEDRRNSFVDMELLKEFTNVYYGKKKKSNKPKTRD